MQAVRQVTELSAITYSSPNLRISNRPQPVPMSVSCSSSVRDTMVAPHTRAMRLLSVFRTRRMAEMLAFNRKCCARSVREADRRQRHTHDHTMVHEVTGRSWKMATDTERRVARW